MPRIPHSVINGVFFLYASREDAEAGRNPGGTGFIVRFDGTFISGEVPGYHFYGVTNWHVACDGGFSTIRLNKKDGGTDIIELGPEEWHFMPGKYDVAVIPLSLDDRVHEVSSISTRQFCMKPDAKYFGNSFGVGDDVFMMGLFIDHSLHTTNVPSARFGNISMLPNPNATIKQPTQFWGESYVVDMHSRAGFSGSPVYAYRTFGNDLSTGHKGYEFQDLKIDLSHGHRQHGRLTVNNLFNLLGIHWGQFPERWELHDKAALKESRKDLIVEGGYVEGMSGMTCVIPAWHIMEVLDMRELKELRHSAIIQAAQKKLTDGEARRR